MQELYSLLQSLTPAEWSAFQHYLSCFSTYHPSELKQLKLASMLMNAPACPGEDACCIAIYGNKNEHGFSELKSSVKEKALDFLLTDVSADKKRELDEADYMIIKMKKKSAQFQHLFYSKTRIPSLNNLLDDIINLAKEYEEYFLLAEHLRIKKTRISWKKGKEEFEKINKEMEYYWDCSRMVNKAEHYYYELMMLSEYSGRPDDKKLSSFFEKAIAELEDYYKQTKSPLIKYRHKFLELGFYNHSKNYLKARSVCLELLDVARNNKSVYRRQRVGVVYDNLSRCEFYLGHLKYAAEYAREAQKNFNPHSENYCIALEQEFYALFAMEQYDKAVEIANQMLASASKKELGGFRYSKYNYLLANALFKQRMFTEALNILSQKREISKDKAGWETGARILKIMVLVETLKLDQASMAVLSLKKFFSRTDGVSLRDKKILNLLLLAEKKGFMFSLLNGSPDKYLKTIASSLKGEDKDNSSLQGGGQDLSWKPFTPEVIPFPEWFAGKMNKRVAVRHPDSYREIKEKA